MIVKVQSLVNKPPNEKMNVENPSEQMGMQLQETTKVHNIQVASRTSSKIKTSFETGKVSKHKLTLFLRV